jgi:predicted Ser/Thr protein kinase
VIGRSLKNYVVEEMLGRGGMGVVYRARDMKLGRPVALKVLPPELVRDEERRRRFTLEARAASAVNHPAIAQIYEIEEDGDTTFIVMEFVEGATLHQLVERHEIDLPSAVDIGIQVADALAKAHEAGIVHRDIKSDNIMVTKDGHPKILDFGLAKLLDPVAVGGDQGRSQVATIAAATQTGVIMGTVAYMSPEQARGLPADRRSDIFSFGIVLYEISAGKLPFEGASALDTMHAIAFEPTRPITSLRPEVPWSLSRIIHRCLQKKPEDRYQDMRETAGDLRKVKREVESGASGGMPILERVRWWIGGLSARGAVWGAAAGAAFTALLLLFFLGGERGPNFAGLLSVLVFGALIFRRFRNRGQREVSRFVKKAAALKEVRLIAFHKGEFTVVADHPTAKSYLKLNALLTAANERLFRGEPMTMVVRENLEEPEIRKLLASPGVRFVRDPEGAARRTRP